MHEYALLLEFKVPELHAENPVHAKHKSSSKALGSGVKAQLLLPQEVPKRFIRALKRYRR
jgi:hypothetical protein